jgi:hypothetical protein
MAGFDNMQGAALTSDAPVAKGAAMTRTPLLLALAATAALAGCNKEDHTIVAGGPQDDMNVSDENLANVQLPPSITTSKIYRCKDNSVIYVDWLSDGTARVRHDRNEVGESVQVGEGQPVQGSADAKAITYKGQPCSV